MAEMPSKTVTIAGVDYTIKALTVKQYRNLAKLGEDADVMGIVWATGMDKEEAQDFFDNSPAGRVNALIAAIFEVSEIGEEARFPG